MSAPAEALAKFWSDLREKSRGRVEHPDLPEELKLAAGELVVQLWQKAQSAAEDSWAVLRAESAAQVALANEARVAAESTREAAVLDAETLKASLAQEDGRSRALEQRLAGEVAGRVALQEQLDAAHQAAARLNTALENVRGEFAAELAKLRDAMTLSEERSQAAQTRALLEIDRERGIAAKAQKELEQVRATSFDATERHRQETRGLQEEIGNLRQRLGNMEGELRSIVVIRDGLAADLVRERAVVQELSSQLNSASRETEVWRQKAISAAEDVERLRKSRGRKSRGDGDQLKLDGKQGSGTT